MRPSHLSVMFFEQGPVVHGDDVPVEHLDFSYVRSCENESELAKIIHVLRSKKEGDYPALEAAAEQKLQSLNPSHRALRKEEKIRSTKYLGSEVRERVYLFVCLLVCLYVCMYVHIYMHICAGYDFNTLTRSFTDHSFSEIPSIHKREKDIYQKSQD